MDTRDGYFLERLDSVSANDRILYGGSVHDLVFQELTPLSKTVLAFR